MIEKIVGGEDNGRRKWLEENQEINP